MNDFKSLKVTFGNAEPFDDIEINIEPDGEVVLVDEDDDNFGPTGYLSLDRQAMGLLSTISGAVADYVLLKGHS